MYHFGQKEDLVRDVILRRSGDISADRLQRLESDDRGWRSYALFIGRNVWDRRMATVISHAFNPAAKRIIAAIRASCPALSAAERDEPSDAGRNRTCL